MTGAFNWRVNPSQLNTKDFAETTARRKKPEPTGTSPYYRLVPQKVKYLPHHKDKTV